MRFLVLQIFILIGFLSPALTQSINTKFGKNRVQYHDDFDQWDKYETENFITYWYGKSRNVGQASVQLAELDHDEIQRILEHRINKKLEIIVYTDLSDLKQSNLGNEEAFYSVTNQTKVFGNKMFVYFDGDHQNLRKQIRRGIAGVYINAILYGSNIQEQVQNAILLHLPPWFKSGLISYAGSNWDYQIEDQLRDVILSKPKKYLDFENLTEDFPEIGGHSMWYYLEQMYGASNIANLVYLTRINRKLEESFYYILGVSFEQVKLDWSEYYSTGFNTDLNLVDETHSSKELISLKNKRNLPYTSLELNNKGDFLAYVQNDKGKYSVYLLDLITKERQRIFKNGTKNIFQETDYNYPLLAWHPSGRYLSLIYEERDVIYLREIDVVDGEVKEVTFPENYQRIFSFDYIDAENFMINGTVDGYSDLFTFGVKSRSTKRLTEDFYDDLDASVCDYNGSVGILFSSNRNSIELKKERLDTILPLGNMDLYFMSLKNPKELSLKRITNTPNISERASYHVSDETFLYLSHEGGLNQRYVLNENGVKLNSNYSRNILEHVWSSKNEVYLLHQIKNQEHYLYKDKLNLQKALTGKEKSTFENNGKKETPIVIVTEEEKILPGYQFQSEFDDPKVLENINESAEKIDVTARQGFEKYFSNYFSEAVHDGKRVIKFSPMRSNAARLQFRWFDIKSKLDNSVLFEGLESYSQSEEELTSQPLGLLFKSDIKDIFEDYKIQLGLRVPTNFNGSEIYALFDNDKRLIDHRYALYRKAETNIVQADFLPIIRNRRNSILALYRLKYPFDVYQSLSLTSSLRFDRFFFLASDAETLNEDQDREKRLSLKLEYIFDNSYDVGLNIKNGGRAKAYLEAINEFDLQVTDGFEFSLSNGFTTILGYDARYYIPILRHAVLALRTAGATSFGSKRMLYYLGGMEGAFGGKFNNDIPIPGDANFAYKALAPHLRGFDHNIRNGSKFILANAELRIPLLKILGVKNVRVGFFRDLQFTGFFDAGMAWHGKTPFAEDNPINNSTLENPPVVVLNVRYYKDPLVMGVGTGIRTTLLGYFVKLDYAWGIETREIQDPKLYLSLGKDF